MAVSIENEKLQNYMCKSAKNVVQCCDIYRIIQKLLVFHFTFLYFIIKNILNLLV